jgi:hypothetical protein
LQESGILKSFSGVDSSAARPIHLGRCYQ